VLRCQAQHTFRPCRSSRLRRFTPHAAVQVYCTLLPALGFGLFPAWPPFSRVSATSSPPRLSQARTSHPPKFSPPKQLNCVTTVVSFSPLFPTAVSSVWALDLKALLCSGVRCYPPVLPPTCCSILPWASFPFKVLPSSPDALPKNSGASPPKRRCSGPRPPKRPRPGCAHTEVLARQTEACPSQRSYSRSCLPRRI
jgi:hypothetical protein